MLRGFMSKRSKRWSTSMTHMRTSWLSEKYSPEHQCLCSSLPPPSPNRATKSAVFSTSIIMTCHPSKQRQPDWPLAVRETKHATYRQIGNQGSVFHPVHTIRMRKGSLDIACLVQVRPPSLHMGAIEGTNPSLIMPASHKYQLRVISHR